MQYSSYSVYHSVFHVSKRCTNTASCRSCSLRKSFSSTVQFYKSLIQLFSKEHPDAIAEREAHEAEERGQSNAREVLMNGATGLEIG